MWNVGSTCFLNALVQTLRAVCLRLGLRIPNETSCPLASLLRRDELDEKEFKEMITARPLWDTFELRRLQDVQEAARVLLDVTHSLHAGCAPGACLARAFEDIFRVRLENELLCTEPGCDFTSRPRPDQALDIQLAVGPVDLQELSRAYEQEEFLHDEDAFACPTCGGLVQQRLRICPAGSAVMLHLKRFGFDLRGRKVRDHVPFPQVLPLNGQRFDFTSVVAHHGETI